MAEPQSGRVSLGGGWALELPNPCMVERTPEGAWAAWDDAHTIDVQIVEVGGNQDGHPVAALTMLGQPATVTGPGWIGCVERLDEPDEHGSACRYAVTAAAQNTLVSCWVAFRHPAELAWAEAVQRGLTHEGPGPTSR